MTLPPAARGPITDSTAPTPSPVQNGRDPSTPSSWPAAALREQTSVRRPALNPASDADLPALIWAGSAGVSTTLSGPRLLPLDAVGSYPLVPAAGGPLWKYCGSGVPKPVVTVNASKARNAAQCWRTKSENFMSGHPGDELDKEVDQLDPDE